MAWDKERLEVEKRYRYEERIGMLCGSDEPTPEQRQIADREAREVISKLQNEQGELL